jgi:DNA polymerase III delta subunit
VSYLIYGRNSVEIDERLGGLRAEVDPSGFSTSVIDVQASTIDEIRATCAAAPFFGGTRLVVLRNPIAAPKRGTADSVDDEPSDSSAGRVNWSSLAEVLASVPVSTNLIVRHDGSLSDGHFLVKFAKKHGWGALRCELAPNADLLAWVHARMERAAREFEARVSGDAPARLVQRLYPTFSPNARKWDEITPDARLIATEIDKLACAAARGVIDVELVDEQVADRGGYVAFALNERIFAGQPDRAIQELEDVLSAGEPAQRVVALIASELSGLGAARCIGEFGSSAVAAASGVSETRLGGLARKAEGASSAGLTSVAELMRHAEESEKTGRGADMQAAIVPLVAEIAESMRGGRRR